MNERSPKRNNSSQEIHSLSISKTIQTTALLSTLQSNNNRKLRMKETLLIQNLQPLQIMYLMCIF